MLLLFAVAFVIGLLAFTWSCLQHESVSGQHVEVSIGCIPDYKEGLRRALRVLSSELRKHPSSSNTSVTWRDTWILSDEMDQWALDYERHDKLVNYGCWCGENWMPVTETMIRAVVGHRGLLSEFEKYGAEHGP